MAEQADDAIASMVRDDAQNVEVILGEGGLLSADVKLFAAAVSGGATGAQAGTLSIMASGPQDRVEAAHPSFDAVGSNTCYDGARPGNSQAAQLVNKLVPGIVMNGVAEGLTFGAHDPLPQDELQNLFKVSTGDGGVARNGDSVSMWTEDTALAVLLKDLKAAHAKGLENGLTMPFNALSSGLLFDSWGQKPRPR